jgi:hypothetical protein
MKNLQKNIAGLNFIYKFARFFTVTLMYNCGCLREKYRSYMTGSIKKGFEVKVK